MTIEERLEKLTERHEALSQTVELLVASNRQNETRLGELMDTVNRLANIVIAREQLIENLDDGE